MFYILQISAASTLVEILLLLLVVLLIIAAGSIFVIRDLRKELKLVYKIRSRFHIEIRKIVNLLYNVHSPVCLEPFTKVVIKNLPHAEKKILLKNIDKAYGDLDLDDSNNKYIVETYENLQTLRRERDAKILVFNQKIRIFPFNVYSRIMRLKPYELYTDNE